MLVVYQEEKSHKHLEVFLTLKILLDNFSEANPNSKSTIEFSEYANNVESSCDIIIDLTSNPPLFPGHKKRDGYFKVDKNDKIGLKDTETKAIQLFGEFEKPIYVNYTENICAHSRNKITGCTKCLDACPAGSYQFQWRSCSNRFRNLWRLWNVWCSLSFRSCTNIIS